MLEDYTMEKKPSSRSAQVPGKANGTELKKVQDAVNSKPFPRAVRRREPNGSIGTKFDPNRKPVIQKSKSFDKRPRPRGQYYNCGKENTKVADEFGSVFVPGSKKQNLNHLLNFHYAPREGVVPGSSHWHSSPPGLGRHSSARWLTSTHKHKYNKEQFLQANCQFVVKADGNYTPYTSNPDALVNWDFIEQIRFQSSEMLSCPICLYPPVAAKMTCCGHVYCWPCILHYLALSDKTWRKCPICFEAVHKHDLRSVIAVPHIQLSVGEEVTMRLMKRERGSFVALPVDQCGIRPTDQLLSVSETIVDTVYSKLLLATPQEVMSIVEHERNELQKQLSEDENCPETCFIEQAINLLNERHAALSKGVATLKDESGQSEMNGQKMSIESKPAIIYNSSFDDEYAALVSSAVLAPLPSDESQPVMLLEQNESSEESSLKLSTENRTRCRYESVSSEGVGSDDGNTTITVEDLEIPTNLQMNTGQSEVRPLKHFYFYQAADGQHIYLHALNVRMLEHYYGSLEHCPPILTGRITEKESGSMTEELRHRLRYLQHLPITCQFEVAEIQLKPPILSKETLDCFQDQLEARRRRRHRRARDERRREKKIIEEENRRWGRYPAPHIRIESHHHFPQCGTDCDSAVTNVCASSVPSSMASSPTPSHDSISSITAAAENLGLQSQVNEEEVHTLSTVGSHDLPGMSFAQMLREGKSKSCVESPAFVPITSKRKPAGGRCRNSDSEPEPEGYVPAPTFSQSFSDAIALAIEKAVANKETPEGEDGSTSGKKKKKKQKQKVLFATGMACSGK